jgi:hypothetical protein
MFTKAEELQSFVASTDMRSHQFHAVDLTATFGKIDLAAAKAGFGILFNNPNAGEHASVVREGETFVRVGAAVSIGDLVTSAATGWVVDVTSSVAQNVLGRMLTAAASGMIGTIDLDWFRVSSIA